MAASIARKVTAVLFALAMVGSVAVGPALADDDDVSVGGDGVSVGGDDGTTVGAGDDGSENGSTTVGVEADEDGVDADAEVSGGDGDGTSGELDCDVSSDTQDPSDACETSGGDSGGEDASVPDSGDAPAASDAPDGDTSGFSDGELPQSSSSSGPSMTMDDISTPEVPADAPDLPVSYTGDGIEAQGETVVPFDALPNYCNPPYGFDDVRENNPVDATDPVPSEVKEQAPGQVPTEPPQTPVGDPTALIGAPISQCTVFDPYDPAVNPTSPPDDPQASAEYTSIDAGQDGGSGVLITDVSSDEEGPAGSTASAIFASRDRTIVFQRAQTTDGDTTSGAQFAFDSMNDPRQTEATVVATAFSRSASLNLDCGGGECKVSAGGVPSGDAVPAIPTGGEDDGGEDPSFGPSADTGEPTVRQTDDGVVIIDQRGATLGDGLPGGENTVVVVADGTQSWAVQDAQAGQGDNQANVNNTYDSGRYPGDDYAQTKAKGNGAGVIVGFNCDDYRCTPTEGTGVYAGPAGMIFEMIPDDPTEE